MSPVSSWKIAPCASTYDLEVTHVAAQRGRLVRRLAADRPALHADEAERQARPRDASRSISGSTESIRRRGEIRLVGPPPAWRSAASIGRR